MKYKIQVPSLYGWGDVKVSVDGGPFVEELYDTREEAQTELDEMIRDLDDYKGRVVPASTPQDDDLYE